MKKLEEQKLAKELKEIRLQRQYKNASKAMMTEKIAMDHEKGAEREARTHQNDALIDQFKLNKIKVKDMTIRANNNRDEILLHAKETKAYKQTLEQRKQENEVLHKQDLQYKTMMYRQQKEQEEDLKVTQAKANPFKDKINKESIAKANTYRSMKMTNT